MILLMILAYAVLMSIAAVSQRKKLGIRLTTANLLFSCSLVGGVLSSIFIPIGLLGLLFCAGLNGIVLNGRINPVHLAIRCVISVSLLLGYFL